MRPLTMSDVRIARSKVIAVPAWAIGDDRNPLPEPWEALCREAGRTLRPKYNTWGGAIPCVVCGTPFYGSTVAVKACSARCAKARKDAVRTRGENRPAARVPVVHQPRACDHCREAFAPARGDARFCSGRCRVAAHRVHARGPGF